MTFKWKVESNDGAWERRFKTKKDAEAYAEDQDDECHVSRAEARSNDGPDPAPKGARDDSPAPAPEVDTEKIRRQMGEESADRFAAILDAAELAGIPEYGRKLFTDNPQVSVSDALRDIHEQWKARQIKDNGRKDSPEPKEPKVRSLGDLDDDSVVANLTRRSFTDIDVPAPGMLRISDWRSIVGNSGSHLQRRVDDLFKSKKLSPDQVSFKSIYQALDGLGDDVQALARDDIIGEVRAVTSTTFGIIAGSTVIAAVRQGYESVRMVGEKLVDEYQSSQQTDTIPAILTDQAMKEVQEGQPYLEGGATEEYHTIGNKKQGRIFALTREMIARDQTGAFLRGANRLGVKAQTAIEKLIMTRVSDSETGFNVFKPQGSGTALYSTAARARGTNKVATNALVDATDLDGARDKLAAMTDNEGDRINVMPAILLVPDALVGTATKILGSEMTPGTENEVNPWGPRGLWRPEIVSSPLLDQVDSTTTWYLGDPAKQFWMKRAFGIETTFQGRESDAWFTHDVAMRFRVAFDVEIGAVDYVYFVQSVA